MGWHKVSFAKEAFFPIEFVVAGSFPIEFYKLFDYYQEQNNILVFIVGNVLLPFLFLFIQISIVILKRQRGILHRNTRTKVVHKYISQGCNLI